MVVRPAVTDPPSSPEYRFCLKVSAPGRGIEAITTITTVARISGSRSGEADMSPSCMRRRSAKNSRVRMIATTPPRTKSSGGMRGVIDEKAVSVVASATKSLRFQETAYSVVGDLPVPPFGTLPTDRP